jgi:hypothetical protein
MKREVDRKMRIEQAALKRLSLESRLLSLLAKDTYQRV